ncbi:MAG TPA: HEAT repeat domain-containing protein [Ktedonobacteraceae bacterium]
MATIYLSSTYSDLAAERTAVYKALRKLRHDVIAMEDYVAADQRPLAKCLADVGACELYVGLFAWRYGYVPVEGNPDHCSITELEYRKAREVGKPCLLFLLKEDAPWSPLLMDTMTRENAQGERIRALRQELVQEQTVSFFQNTEDLLHLVGAAISLWERQQRNGRAADPVLLLRTHYLKQVARRYSSITLPIGPARCSLPAIFQPLTLRQDPLAAEDLQRERRRALLGETLEETEVARSTAGPFSLLQAFEERQQVRARDAQEALYLSPQRRLVILGGPGTGKTTTLKYLTGIQAERALDDPGIALPVFLSLAALSRSGKSFRRYLEYVVEDLEIETSFAGQLWQEIFAGRAFLCLDGLDEVDPRERGELISLLNRKAGEPGNVWIVGSRFTEYKGGQFREGQFTEWEIEPLAASLQLELARRLLPELLQLLNPPWKQTLTASEFVRALAQHPQATAWGENPLLFSLAAVVYVQKGVLPVSRARLYHEVITAILSLREPDTLRCQVLLRIFGEFAFWQHQRGGRTFSSKDLTTFLLDTRRRSWGETAYIARHIIDSGLIEVVAAQTYGFRHLTFQEYLAAVRLAQDLSSSDAARCEESWNVAWGKRTYSRWTEVLRLMVGVLLQEGGKSGLTRALHWLRQLSTLHATADGDPGNLGLLLALASSGELSAVEDWQLKQVMALEEELLKRWIEIIPGMQKNPLKQRRWLRLSDELKYLHGPVVRSFLMLLETDIYSEDGERQKLAFQILPDFTPSSLPLLLQTLTDDRPSLRQAAVAALGKSEAHAPIDAIIQALGDVHFSVRQAAVLALGQSEERVSVETLLHMLIDPHPGVRGAVVRVLGSLRERAPVEAIIQALSDPDPEVRQGALRALGDVGERAPIEVIARALTDDRPSLRQAAVAALGRSGAHMPIEAIVRALSDPDSWVRQAAVVALGRCGEGAPLDAIIQTLSDTTSLVRQAAVRVLGQFRERVPVDVMTRMLADDDHDVRLAVAWTLDQLKERASVERFLQELMNNGVLIRRAAAEILERSGEYTPLNVLLQALGDPDPRVRQTVLRALGLFGERSPIDVFLQVRADPDPRVRREAIEALGQLGEQAPLDVLLQARVDPDPRVRREAIEALGKLGERAPVDVLQQAWVDPDPRVRQAALRELGRLGERAPLDVLLQALGDPDPGMRQEALRELGRLGEQAPLDVLLQALGDPDFGVRWTASWALERSGKNKPQERLIHALDDSNPDIRRAAIEALGENVPLERLLQALDNENSSVRNAAIRVLGKLGERAPLERLLQALDTDEVSLRWAAVEALGMLGERTPQERLIQLLEDNQPIVRQAAIRALGKHAPRTRLVRALADKDDFVRCASINVLRVRNETRDAEMLLAMISDVSSVVRWEAVRAIKEGTPGELANVLDEAAAVLQGQHPGFICGSLARSLIADVIGVLERPSAELLETLTTMLEWPHWQVQIHTIRALRKIRRSIPDRALQRLLALRRDPHALMEAVRQEADDALGEILSLETGIEDAW